MVFPSNQQIVSLNWLIFERNYIICILKSLFTFQMFKICQKLGLIWSIWKGTERIILKFWFFLWVLWAITFLRLNKETWNYIKFSGALLILSFVSRISFNFTLFFNPFWSSFLGIFDLLQVILLEFSLNIVDKQLMYLFYLIWWCQKYLSFSIFQILNCFHHFLLFSQFISSMCSRRVGEICYREVFVMCVSNKKMVLFIIILFLVNIF